MRHFASLSKVLPLRDREEGQALVFVCIGLLFTLLMAGLGVDVGYLRYQKHQMQKAADAAALGAAQAFIDGNDYISAGQRDSAINGFTDGTDGTTVTVRKPPTTAGDPFQGNDEYIEAIVSQPRPNFFMRLIAGPTTTVSSRAVATVNGSGSGCIYAMDPSSNRTLLINGTPNVSATCGVYVRSTNPDALHINGNGQLSAGAAGAGIGVVGPDGGGGWYPSNGAGYIPTPVNVPPFQDPLASLPAPTTNGSCVNFNPNNIRPNMAYCGISLSGNGSYTFPAGMYIIYGGGLTIAGNVTVNGTGVTFYNTGTAGGSHKYAPIKINGGLTVNLTAPTSGTYQGILFFQDRAYTCPLHGSCSNDSSSFGGGTHENLTGALYFPGTPVLYSGNPTSSVSSLIVAWQVQFNGTSQLNNNLLIGGGSPIHTASLAE